MEGKASMTYQISKEDINWGWVLLFTAIVILIIL